MKENLYLLFVFNLIFMVINNFYFCMQNNLAILKLQQIETYIIFQKTID